MPRRTNDFQRLIYLIERALAPRGAKITESAMLPLGQPPKKQREIDVLIESSVGRFEMRIAVEAKNEKRKMDFS